MNSKKPRIQIKRVYDPVEANDGCRILVDRLWPRGLSKEKMKLTAWMKSISPSSELRKWYGHDPKKWPEFQNRYFAELDANASAVEELNSLMEQESIVTLLFSSKETELNNAHALKAYLEK